MSAWHVDDGVAAAYGERRLDPVQRASVEAHAVRCKECRSVLGAGATGPTNSQRSPDLDLEHLWARVEAAVSTPEVGRSGRALLRLGVSMSDVVVTRVVAAPSCDVLELDGGALVPLVGDAVRAVDLERRRIEVDRRFLGLDRADAP